MAPLNILYIANSVYIYLQVSQAHSLVASATQDLLQAKELLEKKGGLLAAGKQGIMSLGGEPTTWSEVGHHTSLITHQGHWL